MNKFFADKDTRKMRLDICRKCPKYISLTGNCRICGCFMRVKTSIAKLSCPDNPQRWSKVYTYDEVKVPDNLRDEVEIIWEDMKGGKFKNYEVKFQAIDLYNTLTNSGISHRTSCTSCLSSIKEFFKQIINNKI